MRALLACAATLLLPLAAAGAESAAGGERYFPAEYFEVPFEADRFERSTGELLRSMQEPPLLGAPLPGHLLRRLRILVSYNHGGAWAVRVDRRRVGGARVTAVEIDGGRTRRIVGRQVYDMDRDAVQELERALDLSRLRTTPALLPVPPPTDSGPLCIPFNYFSFELAEREGSRVVFRDACELSRRLELLLETLHPLRPR